MNPQDFVFYRKHTAQSEGKTTDTVPHRYSYKEAREILAASVQNVDNSIRLLMKGKQRRTKFGRWWAELKTNK